MRQGEGDAIRRSTWQVAAMWRPFDRAALAVAGGSPPQKFQQVPVEEEKQQMQKFQAAVRAK